jgi:transcriptional regulator with XRE-family HTH domain
MEYNKDPFGTIIAEVRKQKGWTQPQLAAKIKVDPIYLCNVERNKKIPSIELAEKLVMVLGLDRKNSLFLIFRTKYPTLSDIFSLSPP